MHPETVKAADKGLPEIEIARRIAAGDQGAFRLLMRRHNQRLFRTVFVLRAVEEMTIKETAAALNLPEATVRARFFRAKALVREALAREIDFAIEDAFAFAGERCGPIVAGVLTRLGNLQTPKARGKLFRERGAAWAHNDGNTERIGVDVADSCRRGLPTRAGMKDVACFDCFRK